MDLPKILKKYENMFKITSDLTFAVAIICFCRNVRVKPIFNAQCGGASSLVRVWSDSKWTFEESAPRLKR
jgi:hypothetical protein